MKNRGSQAIVCAALALTASGVLAQEIQTLVQLPEVNNYVGVGVGAVPDYLGSDDYTAAAAPVGFVKLGQSERFVRLVATDLSLNLLDSRHWEFGPAVNYRWGRSDVDDDAVDAMDDVDGTVELGAFGGWTWIEPDDPRHRFSLGAKFLHDVGGEHDGYVFTASARYFRPVLRPLTIGTGVSASYGDGDYTDTYFGVSPSDAASSGLAPFDADGGLRDVSVPVLAVLSFSPHWHLAGGVVYSRLLGDAADSPVTDERGAKDQLFMGLGLAYAW